jgi:uncharacterized membrane protein YbhN (UPF0104 family)
VGISFFDIEKKTTPYGALFFAIELFFDVFVGVLAEGIDWWIRFFSLGFIAYAVFDSFDFADFFFVGSFAAFKSICGEVERFENGDESDDACEPCME